MLIRIVKGKDKTNTLSCTRGDGTMTWSHLKSLPIVHDLLHYAVETTLGCRDSFFGLIDQGWEIDEFGVADESSGTKRVIPEEAIVVEHMVIVFQGFLASGQPIDTEILDEMVRMSCAGYASLPSLRLSTEQIHRIFSLTDECLKRWQQLLPGDSLTLPFPDAGEAKTSIGGGKKCSSQRSICGFLGVVAIPQQ